MNSGETCPYTAFPICRLSSIGDVANSLQDNVQRMQSAQQAAAQQSADFELRLQEAKQNIQVHVVAPPYLLHVWGLRQSCDVRKFP